MKYFDETFCADFFMSLLSDILRIKFNEKKFMKCFDDTF